VVKQRSTSSVQKREQSVIDIENAAINSTPAPSYASFEEFCSRVKSLHLGDHWVVSVSDCLVSASFHFHFEFCIPKYEIFVEPNLKFHVRVFGWMVEASNPIFQKSLLTTTFSVLVKAIKDFVICPGIKVPAEYSLFIKRHVVPKKFDFSLYIESPQRCMQLEFFRAADLHDTD